MLGHTMLAGVGVNSGVNYKSLILADGPSALWMLNEASGAACTESVAGINASLSGTYSRAQAAPAGIGGISTQLTSSAYAVTASTGTLDAATLSMECWFKQTTMVTGNLLAYGTANYLRFQAPGILNTIFSNANQLSTGNYSSNAWHHSVCVVSPSGLKTYIDGVLAASNSTAYPTQSAGNQIYIGVGNQTEYFLGAMAAVAIYKKELTATQVLAHYIAGK